MTTYEIVAGAITMAILFFALSGWMYGLLWPEDSLQEFESGPLPIGKFPDLKPDPARDRALRARLHAQQIERQEVLSKIAVRRTDGPFTRPKRP